MTLAVRAPAHTSHSHPRTGPVPLQAARRWSPPRQPATTAPARVAAVRVSAPLFPRVAASLRDAGFAVLDIAAHPVGPRPSVVVVELPADETARQRLLATRVAGTGRIFLDPAPPDTAPSVPSVLPGGDEVVQAPFHPLQVAAAALRVSRAEQQTLADWARQAFDTTHVGR